MQSESHKLFVPVLQLSHGGPRLPQIDATEGDGLLFAALEDGQRSGGPQVQNYRPGSRNVSGRCPSSDGVGMGSEGEGSWVGSWDTRLGSFGELSPLRNDHGDFWPQKRKVREEK